MIKVWLSSLRAKHLYQCEKTRMVKKRLILATSALYLQQNKKTFQTSLKSIIWNHLLLQIMISVWIYLTGRDERYHHCKRWWNVVIGELQIDIKSLFTVNDQIYFHVKMHWFSALQLPILNIYVLPILWTFKGTST